MQAAGALNVEPVDAYAQVVVALDVLLTRIELLALVDVFAARLAPHVERRHQSHGVLAISRQFHARDLRRIEIRRIVFLRERQETERLYQNVQTNTRIRAVKEQLFVPYLHSKLCAPTSCGFSSLCVRLGVLKFVLSKQFVDSAKLRLSEVRSEDTSRAKYAAAPLEAAFGGANRAASQSRLAAAIAARYRFAQPAIAILETAISRQVQSD